MNRGGICKGIEIGDGNASGCVDIKCKNCNGTGLLRYDPYTGYPVYCTVCQGCGSMNDCLECRPKTFMGNELRPAIFTNCGQAKPFVTYCDGEF
jgi:hypothetical protein